MSATHKPSAGRREHPIYKLGPSESLHGRVVELTEKVNACQAIEDALAALHEHISEGHIDAIRFYRGHDLEDPDVARLEPVASYGLPKDMSLRFRLQVGEKHFRDHPPSTSTSFVCIWSDTPVLFRRKSGVESLRAIRPGSYGLTAYDVPSVDDAEPYWVGSDGLWIEFPVRSSGRLVGKVSCDLSAPASAADALAQDGNAWAWVEQVQEILNAVGASLVLFRSHESTRVLTSASQRLSELHSLDEVYSFVTKHLRGPTFFDCEHADILTSSSDSYGCRLLVLRGSSFAPVDRDADRLCYQFPHEGPTVRPEGAPKPEDCLLASCTQHAAISRKPINLHELNNPVSRRAQLEKIAHGLTWSQLIPLSARHFSLAIVPIVVNGECIGVMRFADRNGPAWHRAFHASDINAMQQVANSCIGPALLRFETEGFVETVRTHMPRLRGLATQHEGVYEYVGRMLQEVIPETELSGKAYVISQLSTPDAQRFEVVSSLGRLPANTAARPVSLDGTATGYVLSRDDDATLLDYSHDPTGGQHRFCDVPACAKSSLIAPVRYGGQPYGAIAVFSDSYDLASTRHGSILQLVAQELGITMAHRAVTFKANAVAALKHDVSHIIACIDPLCDELADEDTRSHVAHLTNTLHDLIVVHCNHDPPSPGIVWNQSRSLDLVSVVDRLVWVIGKAHGYKNCRVECTPANLRVVLCKPLANAAVYNAILNGFVHSVPRRSPLTVDVTLTADAYVQFRVTNTTERPEAAAARINAVRAAWAGTSPLHRDRKPMGVETMKRVVEGYRLPDGRKGVVYAEALGANTVSVVIKLPTSEGVDVCNSR